MAEETSTETKPKVKDKMFRLSEEDDARLPKLIEIAYRLGVIKKRSFQEYMIFALNCAYAHVKQEYEQMKGIKPK